MLAGVPVLDTLRGEIEQVPPMYSALKRDGVPLYKYAREGIEIERPQSRVTVHTLELLSLTALEAEIAVQCSKGTYIRTLAQDMGRQLHCGAHLTALRRTSVGPFSLDQAVGLEALQAMSAPQSALIALDALPAGLLPASTTQKDSL
jgi:tRNA pseudouridine55 synthase